MKKLDKSYYIKELSKACSKMTYYELVDAYVEECYQHDITRNTLRLTMNKLDKLKRSKLWKFKTHYLI